MSKKYYAPLDDQNCGWLLMYSDQDVPDEIFSDEDCAIKRFESASASWNCYLFELKKLKKEIRRKGLPIKERLLGNIEIVTESGCWIWMLKLNHGYGAMSIGVKRMGAHRVSYKEFVGDIPKGMLVCHKCDVPSCINPDHLFLGTHQDNADDMVAKGRANKGARSKLAFEDVLKIRASKKEGKELAAEHGVTVGTISKIKNMKTRPHQ
jgi:hypothetical protein